MGEAKAPLQQVATVVALFMEEVAMLAESATLVELELVELVAVAATTPQGSCRMLEQVVITNRRQHTNTWAKGQETSKWSRCPPISEVTFVCASFRYY